jgi:transcriptional regulator with XRE-family HTH domain
LWGIIKFPKTLQFENSQGVKMDKYIPLIEMGKKIYDVRKRNHMSQIAFYKSLFPEKDLYEENIKKKMNAIENGKNKKCDYELLFRLHEKYDISLDYLFGFETEYPNYDNKAASDYTGLSAEAIRQLHYWNNHKNNSHPQILSDMTDQQIEQLLNEITRIQESNWILDIVSKLLEFKSDGGMDIGNADLSILYDIYMMTLDSPDIVLGIPEDIARSNMAFTEKISHYERIAADTISFSDSMNELHPINIGEINRQIWKQRLMNDLEKFTVEVRKKRHISIDSAK